MFASKSLTLPLAFFRVRLELGGFRSQEDAENADSAALCHGSPYLNRHNVEPAQQVNGDASDHSADSLRPGAVERVAREPKHLSPAETAACLVTILEGLGARFGLREDGCLHADLDGVSAALTYEPADLTPM